MEFESLKSCLIQKMENGFPEYLHYHNEAHVKDVFSAAQRIAEEEEISDYETRLLLTAVLFHDIGFMEGENNHEEISCNIARGELPAFGYSPEETERVCELIMATKVPQKPKNHLEKIICDADVDYLGRDDFWEIGDKLFKELKFRGLVSDKKEWNEKQVRFLEMHRFFTETSIRRRNQKKEMHLNELKNWLEKTDDYPQKH